MYFRRSLPVASSIFRPLTTSRFLAVSLGGYFPVMQVLPNGRVGMVVREGDAHVGERGVLSFVSSPDGGESWSGSRVITDDGPDARNPAFGAALDGTLLVCFIKGDFYVNGAYEPERTRDRPIRLHLTRSTDAGQTWTPAEILTIPRQEEWSGASGSGSDTSYQVPSPYGKMLTQEDGTILLHYYLSQSGKNRKHASFLLRSRDGGRSWQGPATIAEESNETALCDLGGGRLIAVLRNEKAGDSLWQCDSEDNGYTWSVPRQVTGPGEHPGDLIRLRDGRLLLAYGHRNPPYGVHVMLSRDDGVTWDTDQRVMLVGDCLTGDCGYPSSVQRPDGTVVTAYYSWDLVSPQRHVHRGSIHAGVVLYSADDLP